MEYENLVVELLQFGLVVAGVQPLVGGTGVPQAEQHSHKTL